MYMFIVLEAGMPPVPKLDAAAPVVRPRPHPAARGTRAGVHALAEPARRPP